MQVTLSDKYQVVIPKQLRKGLQLKPGQKIRLSRQKSGKIVIDAASLVDRLAGSLTGVWGKDPDRYIRELRDEWVEKSQNS